MSRIKSTQNDLFGKFPEKMPDISQIDNYFNIYRSEDAASDDLYNDLNIEELYLFSNRCVTPIGEMVLYHKFRDLHRDDDIKKREAIIGELSSSESFRGRLEAILSKLSKKIDYSVSDLLNIPIGLSKWHRYIKYLPLAYCVILPLLWVFGNTSALLVGVALVFVVNSIIHYWNKSYVNIFVRPLLQLSMIKRAASGVSSEVDTYFDLSQIKESMTIISQHERRIAIFGLNQYMESDFAILLTMLFEFVKAIFLIEPITINMVAKRAVETRLHSKRLIEYIGEWDTLFSNASLRCWLTENQLEYSNPIPLEGVSSSFRAKNIYNPLINSCVGNDVDIDNTTIITGSNMSGKSTFMRTIGVNIISSYALNISYASSMEMANYKLYTVLSVSDNISESQSYFRSEVERVKSAIDACSKFDGSSTNIVLIDEIFKGTNTIERISISNAVIQYFAKLENTILIVSTHDIELAKSFLDRLKIFHFEEQIEDQKISFDYKLKCGMEYRRNAIAMLKYCDYPAEIISCAEDNLSSVEVKFTL
ncbi:MAG: hypothetical protein SNH73_02195 [Rikenellaceae bacterium]